MVAILMALVGLSLILSRIVDLAPPVPVAEPGPPSSVDGTTFGLAEDARLVVWFWSPW